ncbi:hypothetical protein MKW92_008047 [Papaver armeniacum]|nr:hypothetical protein MKW92_008047 [Papaver armeniacum]
MDLISAVEVLHKLNSRELNKLLRESNNLTIKWCSDKGSLVLIDMERLAWSLPLHLIAVLVSPGGDEMRLRYLLCGCRLLHSLADIAARHTKLEQILFEEVKVTEQIMDLVFYLLVVLARYEKGNQISEFLPLLHSTLVACSFHLLTGYISTQWQDLVLVLLAHPKVDIFMDAAFDAVRIDINFLQDKLSALNYDIAKYSPSVAEKMAHSLCQQCVASLQFLHSLCQQILFRERVLKNKELCKNGGILQLARAVLRLDIPPHFRDSSKVVATISRLKSKVLSILLQLCETENISYLDEVASSEKSMQLAKSVVLQVLDLLKASFGRKVKQLNDCKGDNYPRGHVLLNLLRMTDILSDDSNFRKFITTRITHVLAEVLSRPQEEFAHCWCSNNLRLAEEEDATLEYDPFVAAGAVLVSLTIGCGTSIQLNDTKTECNFNVISVPQVSYTQHKTSLLVKIIANLHCFVPNVCEEQDRNLFFEKFLECLQMELHKSPARNSSTLDTQKARRVCKNLYLLLDHSASLIPNFLDEEDKNLLSEFFEQLESLYLTSQESQLKATIDEENQSANPVNGSGDLELDISKLCKAAWNKKKGMTSRNVSESLKEIDKDMRMKDSLDQMDSGVISKSAKHNKGSGLRRIEESGRSELPSYGNGESEISRLVKAAWSKKSKCTTSRTLSESLKENDKDVRTEKDPPDQMNSGDVSKSSEHNGGSGVRKVRKRRNESPNSREKGGKRKRNVMNEKQIALIESALVGEPEMQRNAPMLQSLSDKLSAYGSEITSSQLKNWVNNRKARLLRISKEALPPSDMNSDRNNTFEGNLGRTYDSPPDSPREQGYVLRGGSNQTTPKSGVTLGKIKTGEEAQPPTNSTATPSAHQSMQQQPNSTWLRLVRLETGQNVVLKDEKGKEVGKGRLHQVEGRWNELSLEESKTFIVDVFQLNVDRQTLLPHPSEKAGSTFSEAETKIGVMRIAWDRSSTLLLLNDDKNPRIFLLLVWKKMVSLKDIVPAAQNTINAQFILLDKERSPAPTKQGQEKSCMALVADETASVHFQLWGTECDAFEPGDIIRLTNGIFSKNRNNLVLRAGKRGRAEKIGEFTMVFVETPNMSEIDWVPDPNNSSKLVQGTVISPYSRMFPPRN